MFTETKPKETKQRLENTHTSDRNIPSFDITQHYSKQPSLEILTKRVKSDVIRNTRFDEDKMYEMITTQIGNQREDIHPDFKDRLFEIYKNTTPDGYLSIHQQDQKKIQQYLSDQSFTPSRLIDLIKQSDQQGIAKTIYEAPLSLIGGEKLTLEQHTADTMTKFNEYFSSQWESNTGDFIGVSSVLNSKQMLMLFTAHDYGKTLEKISSRQASVIIPHATDLLRHISPDTDDTRRILSVLQIEVGPLHMHVAGRHGDKNKTTETVANETAQQILKNAQELDVDPYALARVAEAYHKCDAGSYPKLFTLLFTTENNTMHYKPKGIEAHNILFQALDDLIHKQ
jgi:hypothetical protein